MTTYRINEDLIIHEYGETFNVRLDYLELDMLTGQTERKREFFETFHVDAANALQCAMYAFNQSQPETVKVWAVEAHVEVSSDVLRDKLKSTVSE